MTTNTPETEATLTQIEALEIVLNAAWDNPPHSRAEIIADKELRLPFAQWMLAIAMIKKLHLEMTVGAKDKVVPLKVMQ